MNSFIQSVLKFIIVIHVDTQIVPNLAIGSSIPILMGEIIESPFLQWSQSLDEIKKSPSYCKTLKGIDSIIGSSGGE